MIPILRTHAVVLAGVVGLVLQPVQLARAMDKSSAKCETESAASVQVHPSLLTEVSGVLARVDASRPGAIGVFRVIDRSPIRCPKAPQVLPALQQPFSSFSSLIGLMEQDPELVSLLDKAAKKAGVATHRDLIKIVKITDNADGGGGEATHDGISIIKGTSLEQTYALFAHELTHYVNMDAFEAVPKRDVLEFRDETDFLLQVTHAVGGEFDAYVAGERALRRLEKKYVVTSHYGNINYLVDCDGNLADPAGLEAYVVGAGSGYRDEYLDLLGRMARTQYKYALYLVDFYTKRLAVNDTAENRKNVQSNRQRVTEIQRKWGKYLQ